MQFHTANTTVDQLWSNILWGQRGNFESVPTDCPQRDERLGWMGDAEGVCCCPPRLSTTESQSVTSLRSTWRELSPLQPSALSGT
jgi:hypothetical protein